MSLPAFLTLVSAVVGGTFTVMGLLDRALERGVAHFARAKLLKTSGVGGARLEPIRDGSTKEGGATKNQGLCVSTRSAVKSGLIFCFQQNGQAIALERASELSRIDPSVGARRELEEVSEHVAAGHASPRVADAAAELVKADPAAAVVVEPIKEIASVAEAGPQLVEESARTFQGPQPLALLLLGPATGVERLGGRRPPAPRLLLLPCGRRLRSPGRSAAAPARRPAGRSQRRLGPAPRGAVCAHRRPGPRPARRRRPRRGAAGGFSVASERRNKLAVADQPSPDRSNDSNRARIAGSGGSGRSPTPRGR